MGATPLRLKYPVPVLVPLQLATVQIRLAAANLVLPQILSRRRRTGWWGSRRRKGRRRRRLNRSRRRGKRELRYSREKKRWRSNSIRGSCKRSSSMSSSLKRGRSFRKRGGRGKMLFKVILRHLNLVRTSLKICNIKRRRIGSSQIFSIKNRVC